jgi:hypothetical protein
MSESTTWKNDKCRKVSGVVKDYTCQKHDKAAAEFSTYVYKNNKQTRSYFNTSIQITFQEFVTK